MNKREKTNTKTQLEEQEQKLSSNELKKYYKSLCSIKSEKTYNKKLNELFCADIQINTNDNVIIADLIDMKEKEFQHDGNSKRKFNTYEEITNASITKIQKISESRYKFSLVKSDNIEYEKNVLCPKFNKEFNKEVARLTGINLSTMTSGTKIHSHEAMPGEPLPKQYYSKVPIKYQQGQDYVCLGYSLASCFYYLGDIELANILFSKSKYIYKIGPEKSKEFIKNLVTNYIQIKMKNINMYEGTYICGIPSMNKKKFLKKNIQSNIQNTGCNLYKAREHPVLIMFCPEQGACNHCVTIVDDLIFDASQKFAVKLSKDALDRIYDNITGVKFVISFHHNARNRKIIRHF